MLLTMIDLAVGLGNVWLRWVVPLVLLAVLTGWFLQR